jgi:hypothetical protein
MPKNSWKTQAALVDDAGWRRAEVTAMLTGSTSSPAKALGETLTGAQGEVHPA